MRLLAVIARLVPSAAREGWRREWEAELAFHLRTRTGSAWARRRWLAARLWAACRHALWLRRHPHDDRGVAARRADPWTGLSADVTYAARGMRRAPGFSLTVIATLALGLGLAGAIFSFADGYLFRPLPFPGADRAYYISDPNAAIAGLLKASDLVALRQSPLAGYGFVEWSTGSIGDELLVGDRRVSMFAYQVSRDFRRALALPLIAGRDFAAADHVAGAPRVAWLSYRFWQQALGGDRDVLGRPFQVEGFRGAQELRFVGILGPEVSTFDLNNQPPDIVLPETGPMRVGPNILADPIVLLPADVGAVQASQQIAAVLQAAAPAADGRPRVVRLVPFGQVQLAGGRPTARVFFAGAMLVLLLASMNLVHLLLGRSAARAAEITTRAALGAGRWRVVRLFLVESLALGVCGIGTGLVVARMLSAAIESRVPHLPTAGRNLSMVPMLFDARVVTFAVVLGLTVAVVGGLWPAWRALRGSLAVSVRSVAGGGGAVSHRLARTILASELTVATIVIVGTVFIGLGIYRYLHQPLGFDYANRTEIFVNAPGGRRLTAPDASAAINAVRGVAGVAAAGFDTATLPARDVELPAQAIAAKDIWSLGVTTGHFEAWGLKLVRGRWFDAAELTGGGDVAVVNGRVARAAWPDADPIGATIRANGLARRVIGIVESRRYFLERDPPAAVYLPTPDSPGRAILAWMPEGGVTSAGDRIAQAIQAAVPGATVSVSPVTFDRLFSRGLGEARFQTPVVAAFGALALALAGVGVFGLVSYLVERRRREFGIRLALGARPADVWHTVVQESVRPTLIGLLLGSVGARVLESLVRSSVFGWSSSGAASIVAVSAGLLGIAVTAAIVPAMRAARIDPAITLRAE